MTRQACMNVCTCIHRHACAHTQNIQLNMEAACRMYLNILPYTVLPKMCYSSCWKSLPTTLWHLTTVKHITNCLKPLLKTAWKYSPIHVTSYKTTLSQHSPPPENVYNCKFVWLQRKQFCQENKPIHSIHLVSIQHVST